MGDAVIVDVVRTPSGKGKPGGALSGVHPADLLATVIRELVQRNGLTDAEIDDVIAGCVTQAGDQSLNIARTATLVAGLPERVPATTVDRQCGSSQQAVHFAAQGVLSGAYDVVIACGVESMSRSPMFSSVSGGDPFAPLAARYPDRLVAQGISAELIAARWKLGRRELDEYSARSHALAADASAAGAFVREIVPVRTTTDEGSARFPEIGWNITAGNSSPLTDGASGALIMSRERAIELGLRPRARFRAFAVTGSDPLLMLTGVIPATSLVLKRAGLSVSDIDVFEVNEAFASVPLAWARELNVNLDRVNPRGGAIALGHPLGASGTRLLATMVSYLEDTGGRFGLQTMCEGGGMANATIIERLD